MLCLVYLFVSPSLLENIYFYDVNSCVYFLYSQALTQSLAPDLALESGQERGQPDLRKQTSTDEGANTQVQYWQSGWAAQRAAHSSQLLNPGRSTCSISLKIQFEAWKYSVKK